MAKKEGRMTVTRRKAILDKINKSGEVLIADLSKEYSVSEVTIRNDLEYLEEKNLVMRARGGAIKVENRVGLDPNILTKSKINTNEKKAIGREAVQLIKEDDTILLDSGTTTAEIARGLEKFNHVTVITNALNIVNILTGMPNIDLIVPGGSLRQSSMSLVGPMAESSLRNFFVDIAFISTDGFDTKTGIYTPNLEEASLNKVMISIAHKIILVTDSSKFLRKSLVFICDTRKFDVVITDKAIPDEDQKRLEEANVKVVIA